jgi:hypothetical protein
MPQLPATRKRRESGYAILMVFLIAATIAIGFYAVAPRVAFESQRDKEQLLVDRGEQYKRAIQLYYRKFRKYPVKMEDLENTQNIRFLRQRYKDPMTGKDEWRLIHIGPGGQFIDSLTQKKNTTQQTSASSPNTFIAEFKSVADPTDSQDQLSPALRRRPSDNAGAPGGDGTLGPPTDPNNPTSDPSLNLNAGLNPGSNPGGFPAGGAIGGLNSLAFDAQGNPTGYVPGGEMPIALQNQLQQNGQTTLPVTGSNVSPTMTYGPNGSLAGPAAIQNLLTSPRPGGPPPGIFNPSGRPMNDYGFVDQNGNNIPNGLPTPSNPQPVSAFGNSSFGNNGFGNAANPNAASTFGNNSTGTGSAGLGQPLTSPAIGQIAGATSFTSGSFAGVASTLKRQGIKSYGDRNKYNEWEFIYDYSKDIAKASGIPTNAAGANNTGGINPFSQNGNNGLGNSFNQNSPGTSNNPANSAGSTGLTISPTPAAPTSN